MALPGEAPSANLNIPPSYEPIDRQTEIGLLSEALAANPELNGSNAPFVLLTFDNDSPYANVARSLECKVFDAYFQNHPQEMQEEYESYEKTSTFFLMVDRENLEPAGVMRITHDGPEGFKSTNDLPTEKCKTSEDQPATGLTAEEILPSFDTAPDNTLDVATIAANPKYGEKSTGSPIVLASLMRAVYKYSLDNGYDDLVAIIDAKPLEKLRAVGLPINTSEKIADNFEYLGAKGNTFIHIPIPEVEQSVSAQSRELFDYIFGETSLMGECELSFIKQ